MPTMGCSFGYGRYDEPKRAPKVGKGKGRGVTKPPLRKRRRRG